MNYFIITIVTIDFLLQKEYTTYVKQQLTYFIILILLRIRVMCVYLSLYNLQV